MTRFDSRQYPKAVMRPRPRLAADLVAVLVVLVQTACAGYEQPEDAEPADELLSASGVQATLSLQSDWGSGYCATVTLSNGSSSRVTGWTAVIELSQAKLGSVWNATASVQGSRGTFSAASYNAAIAPQGSASFGFCANSTGSNYRPALVSLSINGGGASPDAGIGPATDAGIDAVDAGSAGHDAGSAGHDAGSVGPNALCPGASQVMTVAANGSGNFKTIQAAVDAVSSSNTRPVLISVKAGAYNERVVISKPFVCLIGESAESTVISATAGTNIVTGGTVIVTGSDFSAANITFRNSAPMGSGQAVALMAKGDRQQFIHCRFVSYQDTLYANTGTQYFKNCYIQGNTDYIFGDATAVFESCTMNNVSEGTAVTAPRTPQNKTYGFVFLGGSLTANPTTSAVRDNHVHLGRPWGPYAAAAFVHVNMGAHIAAVGWTTMSGNDLTNTRFLEYGSTGPGANPRNPTRATRQLTAAQAANYTVANVLSPWVPSYSR